MPSSTPYKQGDVLLVPFPFTDQTGEKQRPAIVVSASRFTAIRNDLILAAITSNVPTKLSEDELPLSPADLAMAHLPVASIIRAGKLFTLESRRINKKLGCLSSGTCIALIQKIHEILTEQ